MRKSILLAGCAALLAAPFFHVSPVQAKAGDDHFVIAEGVPGAPVGGTTGNAGNGGVGDHDAGADRSQSYDTPANPNMSPMNNSSDDQGHRHWHHRDSSSVKDTTSGTSNPPGAGTGMPRSGNSY